MQTVGKCIKAATAEGRSYKQNLYSFLRNYRATSHATTGVSPATALFGRPIRTRLPDMSVALPDDTMMQRDDAMKENMRRNAHMKLSDNRSHLDLGDKVLIHNRTKGTLEPLYSAYPRRVVGVKGSMKTVRKDGRTTTRNASIFKLFPHATLTEHEDTAKEQLGNTEEPSTTPLQPPSTPALPAETPIATVPVDQPPELTDQPVITSRGRIVRKPKYLNDYTD